VYAEWTTLDDGSWGILVTWSAPASSGGSPIQDYAVDVLSYTTENGFSEPVLIWKGDSETSMLITGIDSTLNHAVRVMALNGDGGLADGMLSFSSDLIWVEESSTTAPPTTTSLPAAGGGLGSSGGGWLGCYFDGTPMWGSVYVADSSVIADYVVYVTDYAFSADLAVYIPDYSFSATSCGLWANADYSFSADFSVYFTPYPAGADFTIAFVDYSFSAGR
jgi:hypothetical protein